MDSQRKNFVKGVALGTFVGVLLQLGGYLLTRGDRSEFGWAMFIVVPSVSGYAVAAVVPPSPLVARLPCFGRSRILRPMPTVALQAHYDGERIILDEPFELPTHTPLIVTVLPATSELESDTEEAWLRGTAASNAFGFLTDPAEDIYTVADGEPFRDAP